MIDYLDPSTFVLRPRDLGVAFRNDTWLTAENETWLNARFPGSSTRPAIHASAPLPSETRSPQLEQLSEVSAS